MKSLSGNSIIMKELNTNIIRQALKAERQATKQRLSELTGLSAVTVGSILQQLTSANEAYEDELVPSNGGRPALRYCYNSEHSHALVIYTHEYHGEDKIYIRVVNLMGECIYKEKTALKEIDLNSFEPIVDTLLEQYPTIKALGFGLPGDEYNEVMTIHDYKNLYGTRFTEHYRQRYGIPVGYVNDVNAAVIGYCHMHEMNNTAAIVYLYFPQKYPPGAGIYINGALYKGHTNFAGEIQYMPLGNDWSRMDYEEFDNTCEVLSNLVISITCLLNPQRIVLYGNFLNKTHLHGIVWNCQQALSEIFVPQILLSDNFSLDFEIGVIENTLDLLKPKLSLRN